MWTAGLVVATGAGVSTAHGLYQVAVASRVPTPIAWLYPLITDGLALVAYAATARLTDRGHRYAAGIVVLAAGLSGLAQAVYLAGALHHGTIAPLGLRFGVGAWPAIAAALTAHLLHLIGTSGRRGSVTTRGRSRPAARSEPPAQGRPQSRTDARLPSPVVETKPWAEVPAESRPATGSDGRRLALVQSSRGEATRLMRAHWDRERAAGRTPSGAELDKVGGTKDYGRKLIARWEAEEEEAAAAGGAQ